ncbi:MAG: hypothetical protein RLZZ142_2424 [Verrucomicrobiota bacterium]
MNLPAPSEKGLSLTPPPARGLGMDLVDLPRFRAVLERQGEAFLERVFTPHERAYCLDKSDPAPFFAARFAAKEAVSKAFGTGIGAQIGLQDIEVFHLPSGAPAVRLLGRGAELAARTSVREILLSLTHTDTLAGATVILQ